MSGTLPIYETFYAWQGEGYHMGRAAFFIRTFGCPVKCPWCDSAGTWNPNYAPREVERLSPVELTELCLAEDPDFVVITGGEPTVHDLRPLTKELHSAGIDIHLETCGAFPLKGDFDWVTVSPKERYVPLDSNLKRADEIKLIVEDIGSVSRWWQMIGAHCSTKHVWLQPEWSRREDAQILRTISQYVKDHGAPFRAGYQLHNLYRVDEMDSRARPRTEIAKAGSGV